MTIYIVLSVIAVGVALAIPVTKRLDNQWERNHHKSREKTVYAYSRKIDEEHEGPRKVRTG